MKYLKWARKKIGKKFNAGPLYVQYFMFEDSSVEVFLTHLKKLQLFLAVENKIIFCTFKEKLYQ